MRVCAFTMDLIQQLIDGTTSSEASGLILLLFNSFVCTWIGASALEEFIYFELSRTVG